MRGAKIINKKSSIYQALVVVGCFTHILFELLFIYAGNKLLIAYNIFSILVYLLAAIFVSFKESVTLFVCLLEMTAFVALSTYAMGWDTGFQNWIFASIVLCLTAPFKKNLKFIFLAHIQAVEFIILYAIVKMDILHKMPTYMDIICGVMNIFGVFSVIFFSHKVLKWSKIMERHFMKKQIARFEKNANVDFLTGLINRYKMNELLKEVDTGLEVGAMSCYIVFGDIDNFKRINDTYGHDAGDEALKAVANIMRFELRAGDLISRWGGDEFLVLIRNSDGPDNISKKDIVTIIERLRQTIAEYKLEYDENIIPLTVTFGISSSDNCRDVKDMIDEADSMLYYGKRSGKNRVIMNVGQPDGMEGKKI